MRKMPVAVAERIEQTVPEFVDLVQSKTTHAVRLRLDDFEDEPDLLYDSVWYAISCGMKVEIGPNDLSDPHFTRYSSR